MMKRILLGTLLLYVLGSSTAIPKREYTDIDLLRKKLMKIATEPQMNSWKKEEACYDLVHNYKNLNAEINEAFPHDLEGYLEALNTLWLWARTQIEIRKIDGLYLNFINLQEDLLDKQKALNIRQWTTFANTVLYDPNLALKKSIDHIDDNINHEKLFVSAYQEASSQICNTKQSPQQLLYNLYKTIAVTELKGYAMMQFSYALLKLYNLGNFTEEMDLLKQQFNNRTAETLRAVKTAMVFAPRELWKCDPKKHREDTTYTELKQVFQGYVVNEVDLNPYGTCKENCGFYSYTKVHGCFKNKFCLQQRSCSGKVLNCQYIDSDMWICPSEPNTSRRYEFIEYENGLHYGAKGVCKRGTTKVDSWWRYLFWHCSYCMCYCDDHTIESDRYFNMRDVTSDIENNKVVIGVRFKKVNQIIHIQIKQGILLPRGKIDENTAEWKAIDDYTIFDHDVKSGRDYHTIMWEERAIDLDDLDAKEGHLLTGLRFRKVGSHLNLEIRITPFNFTTGELMPERTHWDSNDNTEASGITDFANGEIKLGPKRSELKLNKPDVPTKSLAQAIPDSENNQFLYFGPTDLQKDAAQTTIPFIDIQPLEPTPPVPISGAGVYHKGREGYGGFVGLKLLTYNIEPQLQVDLPPTQATVGFSNEINAIAH